VASPLDKSIVFPSDARLKHDAVGTLRLAGRVQALEAGTVWLADAFAQVQIVLEAEAASATVGIGDWLLLNGVFVGGLFVAQTVERRMACPEPRGDGEWARFCWQGQALRIRQRAELESLVRAWFVSEGFVEVKTPTRLAAPGLDSGVDALGAEGGYLVTSPELHMKRLLVGGVPRSFQLATCFRRDESGPLHRAEFTMLEWYRAFADLAQLLDDTESLVVHLAEHLGLRELTVRGRRVALTRPFLRISVDEAFQRYAGERDVYRLAERDPTKYFELMVGAIEPALAQCERPVFLTRYPASQAALARLCPDEPRAAERSELYVGGVELCNGYGELSDPVEQRRRFTAELEERRASGRTEYPLDEAFLTALEEGMPPSAGNALGFDRLVMLLLGQSEIERTVAF
jgi:lysyl-tRNA synthetase class 2